MIFAAVIELKYGHWTKNYAKM